MYTSDGWLTLGTEEGAGNVELLGTDNDDTLAIEDLLGDNGGQTTQEVTLTIDNNNLNYAEKGWMIRGWWMGRARMDTFSKDIWS